MVSHNCFWSVWLFLCCLWLCTIFFCGVVCECNLYALNSNNKAKLSAPIIRRIYMILLLCMFCSICILINRCCHNQIGMKTMLQPCLFFSLSVVINYLKTMVMMLITLMIDSWVVYSCYKFRCLVSRLCLERIKLKSMQPRRNHS